MTEKIQCAICETRFVPRQKHHRFCSSNCRSIGWGNSNWCGRILVKSRGRAKRIGVDHNITVDDIEQPKYCRYLGMELDYTAGRGRAHPDSPSLDRIDNDKGYIKGNVQVISTLANTMKSYATREQLLLFAKTILLDNHELLESEVMDPPPEEQLELFPEEKGGKKND